MQKRVIFISNNIIPRQDAGGGAVVVYRHLLRLKQSGYYVTVVLISNNLANNLDDDQKEFEFIPIQKKRWDPPLRRKTPVLTALRTRLTLKRLTQTLHLSSHDIVIGVLGEVCNLLAYQLKQHLDIPFYLFYHDDVMFNRYKYERILTDKQMVKIVKAADHIYAVSDQMTAMLKAIGVSRATTLYPIPNGYNGPLKLPKKNAGQLQLMAAGMITPVHFNTLINVGKAAAASGARFYCVTDNKAEKLSGGGFVNVRPRFDTTDDLFSFILAEIDVIVVFYSFDKWHEPRIVSSFPSKLVEFCHLGVPILIVAPKESALAQWAEKHHWRGYLGTNHAGPISIEIEKYKDDNYYQTCCEQSLHFAGDMFNPDVLHRQFVKYLTH